MNARNGNATGEGGEAVANQTADAPKDSHFPASNQDPLVGWFSLAKNVKPKRQWKRGQRHG